MLFSVRITTSGVVRSFRLLSLAAFSYTLLVWINLYLHINIFEVNIRKSATINVIDFCRVILFLAIVLLIIIFILNNAKKTMLISIFYVVSIFLSMTFIYSFFESNFKYESTLKLFIDSFYLNFIFVIMGFCLGRTIKNMLNDQHKAVRQQFNSLGNIIYISSPLLLISNFSYLSPTPLIELSILLVIVYYISKAFYNYEVQQRYIYESQLVSAINNDKYKTIGQLAMGIVHEVNNPLSTAKLNLTLIKNNIDEPSLLHMVERAELGVDRASIICRSLLDYSNQSDNRKTMCNLFNSINNAISLLSHKLKNNRLVININVDKNLSCFASQVALEEVLINILSNSMDASDHGQAILVRVDHSNLEDFDDYVSLAITDQGKGMTSEVLSKAFEPFYTTKPVGHGSGLGLAICQRIIESFGGKIVIESKLGAGTTVTLKLPNRKVGV